MKKTSKVFLKYLETKYPEYFDQAINSYFKKKHSGSQKRKLCKLINDSVCSMKNTMIPDLQTTLVLGINHANSHIRKSSTTHLLQQAALGKLTDATFIGNSMYDRLCDDSPSVVLEVLSTPQVLLHYVDKQKLLIGFNQIFKRKIKKKSDWYQVQMHCLDILCNYYASESYLAFEIFFTVLPFIFPLQKATVSGFNCILNSKLKELLPVFQVLEVPESSKNDIYTEEALKKLNFTVISTIKIYIDQLENSSKSVLITFLLKKSTSTFNNAVGVIFTIVAGHAIISSDELDYKLTWIEQLLSFFKSLSLSNISEKISDDLSEETLVYKCIEALSKEQFPTLLVNDTFHKVVQHVKLDFDVAKCDSWLHPDDHMQFTSYKILILLYEFCVNQISFAEFSSQSLNSLFKVFSDSQFQSSQHLFGFLSLLWSNAHETIPTKIQIAALTSALVSCNNSDNFDWFFDNYVFNIRLLKAISDHDAEVRKTGMKLLSSLLEHSKKSSSALKILAEYVCESWEEIAVDHNQCYFALNKWLNPAAEIYTMQSLTTTSSVSTDQYSVLNNFIKILWDDNSPNATKCYILLCLRETDSIGILSAYVPIINKFLLLFKENKSYLDDSSFSILESLLQKFTPKTAVCLKENSTETKVLFECLHFVQQGDVGSRSVQLLALKVLSRDFFIAIPSITVQKELLNDLFNTYLSSTSEVNTEVKKVLGKLSTYAYLVLKDFLDKEATEKNITLKDLTKLKPKENFLSIENKTWKKIIVLLEIIQNKSKLDKRELLIPELFNLLQKTLSFDSQSSVEYVRQLIISTIHNCCEHLGSSALDERHFQVELIVQCIRSSTNPNTHHRSLLLLNLAATMFPDYVLNNVMTVFTFMGNNLARQDDSYSFQVLSQTIETVVPPLLAASSYQEENVTQIVASVIRVFVESLSHIPRHRQLPLFTKLLTTVDPSQYLWIPLGQICDQYATVFPDMASGDQSDWKISPTLEFAVNLHKQFSPSVQIDTCINLLNFLSMLPDFKERSAADQPTENITEPFNVSKHTNQELQIYKYNVLSYINIWLSSQAFISQVSELDSKAMNNLEEKYETLLEKALQYLQDQRSLKNQDVDESSNRFSLYPLLFDLVGHVNGLLPCSLFIRVVRRLLRNPEIVIQKKAIELLNSKLEQQQYLFTKENHSSLLKLLNPLLKIVRKCDADSTKETLVLNQQTALYALHLLTKVIGSEYPSKFFKVLNVAIQILKDNQNEALIVNALLCLAQLCSSLNVEVLPQLNVFMPIIVGLLSDYKTLALNDCLILGIVTALLSLVENLGMFLSSYMISIVTGICMLSMKYLEVNKKILHEKLLTFQTLIAKDVDLRILLTAIEGSYSNIMASDHDAVIPLMSMLEEKLSYCSYTDVEACSTQLEQFFILLLDFRNSSELQGPISLIESGIISALKTFVMKLSVTRFCGFFQKIYQWATATEEKMKLRLFTFYSLTCQLSKSLKNLFAVVAKSFLKHAASNLDSNNMSKTSDVDFDDNPAMLSQHLINILDTLNTCFLHDNSQLIDKDNFEFLMQPLVDQLENLTDDGKCYQERVSNYLSCCIARFMASVSDNTLWKKLNYQVLLKTRHDSAVVRFAAIQVIREVVTVMGDNYLVLLPESIPFLAEIMEDESTEVEQECHSVITEMEKILGEPIRKYF